MARNDRTQKMGKKEAGDAGMGSYAVLLMFSHTPRTSQEPFRPIYLAKTYGHSGKALRHKHGTPARFF